MEYCIMKKVLILALLVMCNVCFADRTKDISNSCTFSTGTAIAVVQEIIGTSYEKTYNGVTSLFITWTSNASGNVFILTPPIDGYIVSVTTAPHATTPSDNYDI